MASQHLHGVIPPITTPFRDDQSIDDDGFRETVEFTLSKGVHGICIGGSTGEGHTLTTEELAHCVSMAAEVIRGRVPLVAGIIANSTRSAIEKSEAVDSVGVDALQVTPVHYVFTPDEDATLAHFERLCSASRSPVVIYNVVPWNYLSPNLLVRIMERLDGVIGVKQSAGDLKLMADLLISAPENRVVLSAVDALLYPSFALGAHGTIAANPAAIPGVCVGLWEAVQFGDHERALKIHQAMLKFWNTVFSENLPANVKYCLRKQGVPAGGPRMPMPATSPEQAVRIDAALENVLRFE